MSMGSRHRLPASLVALMLSIALSYGAVLVFRLHFMVVDDALLAQIAAGAYGEAAAPFLLFPNILVGWLLAGLYSVVPGVPWYAVVVVGLECLAFWHLYCVLTGAGVSRSWLVALAAVQLLSSILLTYTVVAAVATAAGVIGAALRTRRPGGGGALTASTMLALSGYLLRAPSFAVALAVCAPLAILSLLRRPARARLACCLAAVILAIAPASALNRWAYSLDSHDADSLARQEDSRRMVDYAPVDYDAHRADLEAMGWSRNDLEGYYDWVLADFDVYSVENLERLGKIPSLAEKYQLSPLGILRGLVERPTLLVLLPALLCAVGVFVTRAKRLVDRRDFACLIGVCLMALCAIAALVVRQRAVANALAAVVIPFFMAFLSAAAVSRGYGVGDLPEGGSCAARRAAALYACCALALACSAVFAVRVAPRPGDGDLSLDRAVDGWMESHPGQLVATGSRFQFMRNVPAFEVSVPGRFLQTVKVGSWSIDGRRWWYQLDRWGIDPRHLLLEMAGRDDIVFMPDDARQLRLVETFIREHSGREVSSERVSALPGGRALYRLSLS